VLRATSGGGGTQRPLNFSDSATSASVALVPATTSEVDGQAAGVGSGDELRPHPLPPIRLLVTLCVGRLVIVGGAQFATTALLVIPTVFPHADPLLKLALLLE
jgi:hypothetical protein